MTQPTRQPTSSRQPKSNQALAGVELAQAMDVLAPAALNPLPKAPEMDAARKMRSTGKQVTDEERFLSDTDATAEGNGPHQAQSGPDSDGQSNVDAWIVAQAHTGAGVTDTAGTGSNGASCEAQNSADCDDDKGLLWWGHGPGAWLKLGLGAVGAALLLGSKSKEDPHAELETSMAAGPFKANGMELHFYGASGLLLKIQWDAEGKPTVQSNTALLGDVRVLSSNVNVNGQDQTVVSGIEVNFATYTGALLAVIFDPTEDSIPVEYFDEVAGLIPLDTALRAMTVIKPGQNFLAITPLTELAAQLAGVTEFDEETPEAYNTLLLDKDVVSDFLAANQTVSQLVGMDIVNVLPTAVNDSKFNSEIDLAAKKYGEILASVSNLVPGNFQAGLDVLKNKKGDPEAAKILLKDSLADFNSQADATPATVFMTRPGDGNLLINQAESQALTLSGSSQNAQAGSMVWVRLYGADGKSYQSSARVQEVNENLNGTWTVTLPGSLSDLGFKDGGLTIQAYIDAKHVASQRYELDASPPQAPSQVPDLNADEDSGRSNTDNTTSALRPQLHIGALPEAGMTVQLLVNGDVVAATFNAQTGALTPNQALPEGELQISYRYTDAAGNTGPASAALTLTLDTTAPLAPDMAPWLLAEEDTGRSNFDQNTATNRPALQIGVLPEADLQVELLVNGQVKAATYSAETGTLKPDAVLTDGDITLTYRFVDRAGNRSEPGDATVLRIDTTATTVVLQSLTLSQDSGVSSTDWVTQVANQSVRAQLSAPLADGEKLLASLDGGSTWSDITSSVQSTRLVWAGVVLLEGGSTLQWKVVDAAGNEGAVIRQNAMLDRAAPTAPTASADLQADSDSGHDNDNNTRATRPVFDIQPPPADAAEVELLLNGQVVSAQYHEQDNVSATLQPTSDLNDGVYAVSYRYADTAGNRSEASTSLSLTVDTRAPVNSAIQAVASGGFSGTFEAGCDVQLRIAGLAVTGVINTTSGGTWSYVPSADELGQLRGRATSDIQLVVTDAAGNVSQSSRVATPDDFSGPYIKEYIPADGGKLAYGPDGQATLNVVFSKAIEAVAGSIKVYEEDTDTLIATIAVTDTNQVQIAGVDGNDVFIRLPAGLNVNSRYYVVIEADTFRDGNGEFFTGKTQIGTAGWDFEVANAAIAPDFVALDDRINAVESAQVVQVSGKVVASLAILQDIAAGNLTISVNTPLGAQAVNANSVEYNNQTGSFVFSVPAAVWAEGVYGYTVELAGSSGDALGVTASYTFYQLKVDLTAPTQFAALTSATDDAGSIMGELWSANATSAVTDDTSPYLSGTLSANLSDDARVVVYRQDVSNPNTPGAEERLTSYAGLVPTGNTWSLTDSGLADGTYEYTVYVEDEAGNRSQAGAARRLTVDTTAPNKSVIVGTLTLTQDTGASATDWITQTPTQTVTGTLTAALGQDESLWVSQDGGTTWSNITTSVSDITLSWAGVSLQEGQGSLRFQVRDAAGNVGQTIQKAYTLDSTAPVPPTVAPDLLASDDSGSSDSDNITYNTRPQLQVGNLPDGAGVQLLVNGQPVDARYDPDTRTLRPDQALGEGTHLISYRWVDTAGNASEASPSLSVQVDNQAPQARFTQISLSNDTGTSNTDLVTKTAPQNITAQLSGVVSPTDVVWGSLDSGSTWVNVTDKLNIGGQLRWPGVSLAAGTHSVQFKVLDAAGNTGPISSQAYTLDTTAPTHTMTGIQLSADTGASATDFLTRHPQQTVSGTLQLSGVPASLAAGERLMGSANGGITWQDISASLDGSALSWVNVTLQNGESSLRFKVLDLAGNESVLSTQTYTLDTVGPAALTGTMDLLKDDQDTGVSSTDNITRQSRPTFQVENMPGDAVSAELFINGRWVDATFSSDESTPPVITLTPNELLDDGTYQVSYRFVDAAGNSGDAVEATMVVIDTRAPANTALVSFAPGAIAGTYEAGSTLSLMINGVPIDSSRLQLNPAAGTWRLVPTEAELNDSTLGLLNKANSTFELTATDAAGNENSNSATVTKDAFNAPYVKEFIPTDGGVLANGLDGKATLNLVFSKAISAGTGLITLWNGSTAVAEIDVATATSDVLRIVGGNDVYVTLPGLTPDVRYHVTLAAGSFVDANQQPYAGDTLVGEAGWDFVGAVASIAPDFVAQDDRVNLVESGQTVLISGKVTASAEILQDMEASDLSISVTVPQGANAVTPTLESYDKATGSFIFSVPAQTWTDGQYGYTVSLQGASGNAAGVTASYSFDNLGVDLIAPTGIRSSLDGIFDDVGAAQGNLFPNHWKLLESGYASTAGTTKVTDINVTDLDLSQISVTMGGGYLDPNGAKVGTYNSGGTVYNSDRSSVSFWVQFTDASTKAVKLQLTDTASGIQLKAVAAKYLAGSIATTYDWNTGGIPQLIATSGGVAGYGVSSLQFVGDNMSDAMLGSGYTDDNTPTLRGTLTRALGMGERIAIDRTDEDGNTVTVTGTEGLIVQGTSWAFTDKLVADGHYTYKVYVEDLAGNRSVASPARTITVDAMPPEAKVLTALLSADTGSSNSDGLTNVANQTLSGTLDEALQAGEKLMLSLNGGVTWQDITHTVSGTTFSGVAVTLSPGEGKVMYRVMDRSGLTGPVHEQAYTLDTVAPVAATVNAQQVEFDGAKVIEGTAQLAAGDRLTVSVNGAAYAVTTDTQGTWTLDLDTATPQSGALGQWAGGTPYDVVATVTDAAGNATVDASAGELRTLAGPPAPLQLEERSLTRGPVAQMFGNVLMKQANGSFAPTLGVTVLDDRTTYASSIQRWDSIFGSTIASNRVYWDTWVASVPVDAPYVSRTDPSSYGYALSVNSATANTPEAIAEFLRTNQISASSPTSDKFYLVINVDNLDGSGQSGSVVVYVNERLNTLPSIDPSIITIVSSHAGRTAAEFTATDFKITEFDLYTNPIRTIWIDGNNGTEIVGTAAGDRLMDGYGSDVIRGNGGKDFIALVDDGVSDTIVVPLITTYKPPFFIQGFHNGFVGGRDQLDLSEFGFYREHFQNSGVIAGPAANVSGKVYVSANFPNAVSDKEVNSIADAKFMFIAGYLTLDENSESIVIFGNESSAWAHAFHVSDSSTEAGIQLNVLPLFGMVLNGHAGFLTAENITARPVEPEPQDYISIGRLLADKSAFGAWFDSDEDGVYDAGEELVGLKHVADWENGSYHYTLDGVDFASGHYTLRFVDVLMSENESLVVPDRYGFYGPLKLGDMGFGDDDKVIIDMETNAMDWMGMDNRFPFSEFGSPTSSRLGDNAGAYGDGKENLYNDPAATGLFGQLNAGTRPEDNLSMADYARLEIFVDDVASSQVRWEAFKYVPPTTRPNGGVDAIADVLVDLGVPVTASNLEIMVQTTFIA